MYTNSGDTDQTLCSAASDLGLHCLSMSHKMGARLIWFKDTRGVKYVMKIQS